MHADFHHRINAAARRLVCLEQCVGKVTGPFPGAFPDDFASWPEEEQEEQVELRSSARTTLWNWVLLRIICDGEPWSEAKVRRAVAKCSRMEEDAIAYHIAALARRAKVVSSATLLSVAFASLGEGMDTLMALQQMQQAAQAAQAAQAHDDEREEDEPLWWLGTPRRPRITPCEFLAARSAAQRRRQPLQPQEEEEEPGQGHVPAFPRSQLLTSSHIRQSHGKSLRCFEASPLLYAVLNNHSTKKGGRAATSGRY